MGLTRLALHGRPLHDPLARMQTLGSDAVSAGSTNGAEQAFLVRWWSEQTPAVKELFQDHVQRGHMEFVNGGYVQHDEAASHYSAMIDQTTLGHMCASLTVAWCPHGSAVNGGSVHHMAASHYHYMIVQTMQGRMSPHASGMMANLGTSEAYYTAAGLLLRPVHCM